MTGCVVTGRRWHKSDDVIHWKAATDQHQQSKLVCHGLVFLQLLMLFVVILNGGGA